MSNIEKYRSRSKTAVQNGKKGGRPRGSKTKQKPNENPTESKQKPNENQKKAKEKEKEKELKATKELSDSYASFGFGASVAAPLSAQEAEVNIAGAEACMEFARAES